MAGIKALLILAVAALDLAVVPGSIGTDPQLGGSTFKQGLDIAFAVRKAVGELSVWTHSTWIPFLAYHLTNRFRKSAEE